MRKIALTLLLCVTFISSVGYSKIVAEEQKRLPDARNLDEFEAEYLLLENRLINEFIEGGYVVSKWDSGANEHVGDSLLWSGIAMGLLSCEDGQQIESALLASLEARDGAFVRFEPLPDNYIGNEVSRDGLVGIMYGFASRAKRCPDSYDRLKSGWRLHYNYVRKHNGELYDGTGMYLTPTLKYVWQLLSHYFDLASRPSMTKLRIFEAGVVSGAKYISENRDACYPIHLSTLEIVTVNILGGPMSDYSRRKFCWSTKKTGLPLTDWFCNRGDQKRFLRGFKLNQWEYRHQRCRDWETPDGKPGLSTPALDYLIHYKFVSGFH